VYRKIVLGLGLAFSFVGMILTLMILQFTGVYLAGNWPPDIIHNVGTYSDFMGLVTLPTALFIVFGFVLLAFGVLYPKNPTPVESKVETSEQKETKP